MLCVLVTIIERTERGERGGKRRKQQCKRDVTSKAMTITTGNILV
jgi:hypothetical protein